MKKTLLIALAGMMMFAFTQCGGGKTKGSKEFQDSKELIEKLETTVKDAKTCDELQGAVLALIFSELGNKQYTDEEKMTDAEKAEIEKLGKNLQEVIESKSAKLGCDEK